MGRVCLLSPCTIALEQQWFVLLLGPGLSEKANEVAGPWWTKPSRWVHLSVGDGARLTMWYTGSRHTVISQPVLSTISQKEIPETASWLATFISLLEVSCAMFTPAYLILFSFYHINPRLVFSRVRVEENLIHDLCLIFYEKHSWSYCCFQHIWKWFLRYNYMPCTCGSDGDWDETTHFRRTGALESGRKPTNHKTKIHFLTCHIMYNTNIFWDILKSKRTVHGEQWKRDLSITTPVTKPHPSYHQQREHGAMTPLYFQFLFSDMEVIIMPAPSNCTER